MAKNKKRLLVPEILAAAGWEAIRGRDDVEALAFPPTISSPEFNALLRSLDEVNAVILGLTRFGETECGNAHALQVVARIGVGYDTVDVEALTAHGIPLMVAGTANSVSVAEQALFMMLMLARRGAHFDRLVRAGGWSDRLRTLPIDLMDKTLLIVGFGRIGTRLAKRCLALEMNVVVYDPYVPADAVRAAGCEPTDDLDQALPRADFVSIHCPRTKQTEGMFNATRLGRMKPTAYLINTARGGIIDEAALHAALAQDTIAGAGIDVFDREPASGDHPLLQLDNIVTAPHMAGVTRESTNRMAFEAVRNVLSVFDGTPIRENVVNAEVLRNT